MRKAILMLALLAGSELALSGCGITDPYSQHTTNTTPPATTRTNTARVRPEQNSGETAAPPAPPPAAQNSTALQSTPEGAIEQFASLYINWNWLTLNSNQRQLAKMSVGSARLAEKQAAAASQRDSEISRARIYNRGQIIAITPSRTDRSQWVIVTREQTGGNSQYDGLQAADHVTLAAVAQVPGGYAISQWLPQT
jgi:hypothetical protein